MNQKPQWCRSLTYLMLALILNTINHLETLLLQFLDCDVCILLFCLDLRYKLTGTLWCTFASLSEANNSFQPGAWVIVWLFLSSPSRWASFWLSRVYISYFLMEYMCFRIILAHLATTRIAASHQHWTHDHGPEWTEITSDRYSSQHLRHSNCVLWASFCLGQGGDVIIYSSWDDVIPISKAGPLWLTWRTLKPEPWILWHGNFLPKTTGTRGGILCLKRSTNTQLLFASSYSFSATHVLLR